MSFDLEELANGILYVAQTILAYFGAAIVAYGGFVAIYQTFKLELRRSSMLTFKLIRGGFAARIILGLDFLIASDILTTIGHPDILDVVILGGVVLIRTVLTIVLSQETKEVENGIASTRPEIGK